ncbi:MAG: hypothetical protein M1838_002924 [Thelocarpon superellum]|nr:MAG: hypothetical protein M1838_002924 [Thelocarpon superellum]
MFVTVTGPRGFNPVLRRAFLTLVLQGLKFHQQMAGMPQPQLDNTIQVLEELNQNYSPGTSWIDQCALAVQDGRIACDLSSQPALTFPHTKLACLAKFGHPQKDDFREVEQMITRKFPATVRPKAPMMATHGDMTVRIDASDSDVPITNASNLALALSYLNAACPGGGMLVSGSSMLGKRTEGTTEGGIANLNKSVILPANLTLSIYEPGSWGS